MDKLEIARLGTHLTSQPGLGIHFWLGTCVVGEYVARRQESPTKTGNEGHHTVQRRSRGLIKAPEQGNQGQDQSRQEGPGHSGVWAPRWHSGSGGTAR